MFQSSKRVRQREFILGLHFNVFMYTLLTTIVKDGTGCLIGHRYSKTPQSDHLWDLFKWLDKWGGRIEGF